jgi:hypothetical protein
MKHLFASIGLLLATGAPALADLYGFDRITSNAPQNIEAQFSVDATDFGGGQVDFKFVNNVGVASNVAEIYFDDDAGVLTNTFSLIESATVDFAPGGSPPNLPGGNTISFVADYRAGAQNPSPQNGLNQASDFLIIRFTLAGGKTFADVISAINGDTLRMGLHVQAIGTSGQSDSFVNDGPVIPSPGASVLSLIGLAMLAVRRSRPA